MYHIICAGSRFGGFILILGAMLMMTMANNDNKDDDGDGDDYDDDDGDGVDSHDLGHRTRYTDRNALLHTS